MGCSIGQCLKISKDTITGSEQLTFDPQSEISAAAATKQLSFGILAAVNAANLAFTY